MSESHILKTFLNVKDILAQNINIIDKIIEQFLEQKIVKVSYNRQEIYTQLCKIENFLLFFLYNTPMSTKQSFKSYLFSTTIFCKFNFSYKIFA